MSQVKIYGLRSHLGARMPAISDVIHSCVVDALPCTIIEFSMFEGRSVEAKKTLIRLLFERFERVLRVLPQDVEITIFETPKSNWGFRGLPGDEHVLDHKVNL